MLSGRLDGSARPTPLIALRRANSWREVELLLLVLLVVGVYFSRMSALTVRGEESRWARVAQEMIETGDWIVPRQQGKPFPDRPPLNSWAMIAASQFTGQLNAVAIRLPSVMATLLTTLLIYLYSRNFLSRVGAFGAAVAYPTMAQVLQLGRQGESDSLLMLSFSAALFAWHYGYACRRQASLAWMAGYALVGVAALAKGPQGPVYFVAITGIYLALKRDWKFLFSPWQLAGLAVFVLIVGAWQVPFSFSVESASAHAVWSEGGALGDRFHYVSLRRALTHWVSFPSEVFVCLMPWSFLLPVLASRWFRQNLGTARGMFTFLLTACAVAFPTCWLPADSRPRHFMSLYPCVAPLMGLVIQRSWESAPSGWWSRSWDRFLFASMGVIGCAAMFVAGVRLVGGQRLGGLGESMSALFVMAYVALAFAVLAAISWSRKGKAWGHAQAGILAVGGFMGVSYTGVVIDMQMPFSNNPADSVAAVRDLIPSGERLVSFGPVHHLFAYYYEQPIELEPLEGQVAPLESDATYFCFAEDPSFPKVIVPFTWDCVAEISCERARSEKPRTKVFVGKRRFDTADQRPQNDRNVVPATFTAPVETSGPTADRDTPMPGE